jgi:hypothetical protein
MTVTLSGFITSITDAATSLGVTSYIGVGFGAAVVIFLVAKLRTVAR